MPSLIEIKKEIDSNPIDNLKKYVKLLSEHTNRNVILYYSGWLNVSPDNPVSINDNDMNGFMAMTHGLTFEKRLDLILHTPEVVLLLQSPLLITSIRCLMEI